MTVRLTPVETHGDRWYKRDDLYQRGGVAGGKVRTCDAIIQAGMAAGKKGVITAGSRSSPQVNIVAHLAKLYNLPCQIHTPCGDLSPEVQMAVDLGAELVQHKPGHNSVIIKRAKDYAAASGWIYVPFGMECDEAVKQTKAQVANLPITYMRRLVVPVGSGMTLAGILHGIKDWFGHWPLHILGIVVGASPDKRLAAYAPTYTAVRLELRDARMDYHKPAPVTSVDGIDLDPYYEAKCIPHLLPGDCLWVVGIRKTAMVDDCCHFGD
jgi:1-aminocyclopropane-1-carboxylate deaminase/D-cysteine desulfhydrase-like pyridoxal-dependent ACC family enzyme